ncbi:XRE family transcriptional regulator [Streptomyces sp. H10-C2]|uniref:MmyB family transcriptional regulator n=1 Tax=unclassified Streptomyces TaxID=2593676 RepID=UPI0024BA1157|nr:MULTISPECIES: XRE family transcriptional regulator [unclassified Streptomyces]MDJ0342813.1 XRE family transcriptional regulator [Streptomyces sp. PH10-H1]MDJ0372491.1 XRE family transcriptional regulator [Streptomyces sp. H10-C2]
MTQLQMDLLLNRAEGTYARLERCVPGTAFETLLPEVAKILRLSDQEWAAVWRYALTKEPPYPLQADQGLTIPGAWRGTLDSIGVMAYINDAGWGTVAFNKEFSLMFPRGEVPQNTMQWMLTCAEARDTLAQWGTQWAPTLIAQVRAAVALHSDNETLAELEWQILADPVSGPLYRAADEEAYVQPRADVARPLQHATYGLGWVTMCASSIFGAPGSRLMLLPFTTGPRPPALDSLRARPLGPHTGYFAA